MQYKGSKRWSLWAPWDVQTAEGDTVTAHTRFEAVSNAGDAVYYPPAWFHATSVDPGDRALSRTRKTSAMPPSPVRAATSW